MIRAYSYLCVVGAALLVAFCALPLVEAVRRPCSQVPTTDRCAGLEVRPADVLFLVDGSETMYPEFFYGQMLDYVQQLQCSFNSTLANRVGMLVFNNRISWKIRLDRYTEEEWYDKVDEVRNDATACCTCCTPVAEAFDAARDEFLTRGVNPVKLVIMIGDGDPSQNDPKTNRDPIYNKYLYHETKFPEARYLYQTVPRAANQLKEIGTKIILLGVPNRFLNRINMKYFHGELDPERHPSQFGKQGVFPDMQCVYRASAPRRTAKCRRMLKTGKFAFPIANAVFSSDTFEPDVLLDLTAPELCRPLETSRPTTSTPTKSPIRTPSRAPSSSAPSRSPSRAPTMSGPTISPTTTGPSKASTTSGPSKSPTSSPHSSAPSRAPTTSSPSRAPTTSVPTNTPSFAPTDVRMPGLDMYILLDRSRSLTYGPQASVCREAEGGVAGDPNSLACWRLFVGFARAVSTKLAAIGSMGWKDDRRRVAEGLRMTVIAFWCTDKQTRPQSQILADNVGSEQLFLRAMNDALSIVPNHGTCPSAAIEQVVMSMQQNQLLQRPFKAMVTLTDGIFYDMPRPKKAISGVAHFGMLSYALGIAMPKSSSYQYGLTPAEVTRQKNQLRHIALGNTSRVFNFGGEGYNLLPFLAGQISEYVERDIFGGDQQTWWCGFANRKRCVGEPGVGNGIYCKWMLDINGGQWPGGNVESCKEKGFCDFGQNVCKKDPHCQWISGKCHTKPQYATYLSSARMDVASSLSNDDLKAAAIATALDIEYEDNVRHSLRNLDHGDDEDAYGGHIGHIDNYSEYEHSPEYAEDNAEYESITEYENNAEYESITEYEDNDEGQEKYEYENEYEYESDDDVDDSA